MSRIHEAHGKAEQLSAHVDLLDLALLWPGSPAIVLCFSCWLHRHPCTRTLSPSRLSMCICEPHNSTMKGFLVFNDDASRMTRLLSAQRYTKAIHRSLSPEALLSLCFSIKPPVQEDQKWIHTSSITPPIMNKDRFRTRMSLPSPGHQDQNQ